jgi:hypothetical protein
LLKTLILTFDKLILLPPSPRLTLSPSLAEPYLSSVSKKYIIIVIHLKLTLPGGPIDQDWWTQRKRREREGERERGRERGEED